MKPTTWRLLVGIVAVSAAVGWGVVRVWSANHGDVPNVPWTAPVVIAAFAVGILVTAFLIRPRIKRRSGHKPLEPIVAARYGVLSLATSRAGAALLGAYGGYLVVVLTDLTTAYRQRNAVASAACVLASASLVVAGLVLERICRIPPPKDEQAPSTP